jgi:hypothetical protein
MSRADLSGADLSDANLENANLDTSTLHNTRFDGALLTDIHLWETQRAGWSIKNVICQRAYWDRDHQRPALYSAGEFEKLHAEHPTIRLFYKGGVNEFELSTLPALFRYLMNIHKGAYLRLKAIEDDAGGAVLSIIVEDTGGGDIEALQETATRAQQALEQAGRVRELWQRADAQNELLVNIIIPRLLEAAQMKHITIHGSVGNIVEGGTGHQVTTTQTTNYHSAIRDLVAEACKRRGELSLAADQAKSLDEALTALQKNLAQREPELNSFRDGLNSLRHIFEHAAGAMIAHGAPVWLPAIIHQIDNVLKILG